MVRSISASEKKRGRGRPKTTGTGKTIGVRMLPHDLAEIDWWIRKKAGERISLPEAIRSLVRMALMQERECGLR
jgi:hypothetical protein